MLDKPRRLGDDLIFRTKRGHQFRQESLHRAWAPVRDAFTAKPPDAHHLRERLAVEADDRLDFYELRHFGASYMLNVLALEPWVIAQQLRHSDGGALVLELYGHANRIEAIRRIREAFKDDAKPAPRGTGTVATRSGRGDSEEHDREAARMQALRAVVPAPTTSAVVPLVAPATETTRGPLMRPSRCCGGSARRA